MLNSFNHNVWLKYNRHEDRWELAFGIGIDDACREMASLIEDGIPESAIDLVSHDYDRCGGRRYYRVTIDLSADNEVRALAQRIYNAWLEQKRQDDERFAAMHEAALQHQQSQSWTCEF